VVTNRQEEPDQQQQSAEGGGGNGPNAIFIHGTTIGIMSSFIVPRSPYSPAVSAGKRGRRNSRSRA
jgi:hypothetical protein